MAGTTSRYGLALMSGGSDDPSPDEVADVKVINDGLKLIDGFLGVRECTSGTRPSTPKVGQSITETDTGFAYYWNGVIWVRLATAGIPGLVLVKPVSVAGTGVTLGADGRVTFAGSMNISVNGVFTDTYENYQLVLTLSTSAQNNVAMQLRAAGTNYAGATHRQFSTSVLVNGTTVVVATNATATEALIGTSGGTGGTTINVDLSRPFMLTEKSSYSRMCDSARKMEVGNWWPSAVGKCDGLTLFSGTPNTFTGTLQIFGVSRG